MQSPNEEGTPRRIFIHQIVRAVARRYGIPREKLLSDERTADVVRPRHIAMYLAKTLTGRSMPTIGYYLGGRNHVTVIHAIKKMERRLVADPVLAAELAALADQIRALQSPHNGDKCSQNVLVAEPDSH